ncbi:DNA starvation/stationary phase protection protein [Pandoraea captiosa]|uniref:DNA starvation/stationary phase protection protein n=1 Tax=Pandoraea captiosa TaxID=2508302 RepID=A0A5E5APS5_9BURK|nr:DNA starvation/stationary phase protection protein [Pandoraea captiosa]
MFEGQDNELAMAVDQLAERIRVLGYPAQGAYKKPAKLSSIPMACVLFAIGREGQ